MLKRAITSIFIIIAILGSFALRQFVHVRFFDLFIYIVALACAFEFLRALKDGVTKEQKFLSYLYTILIIPCIAFAYSYALSVTILYVAIVFLFSLFHTKSSSLEKLSKTIFSMFYPTGFFIAFAYINSYHRLFNVDDKFSLIILVLIFGCATITDVMAYLVGCTLKGKKLCPTISPNKTISGAIGGLIGGTIASLAIYYIFKGLGYDLFSYLSYNLPNATPFLKGLLIAVIGLVFAIVGEVGDLAESLIKRQLGVKDMGNLLPGHGGMLDRMDSIVFISLFAHILFSFLVVG